MVQLDLMNNPSAGVILVADCQKGLSLTLNLKDAEAGHQVVQGETFSEAVLKF
jgi:hypothetical protein